MTLIIYLLVGETLVFGHIVEKITPETIKPSNLATDIDNVTQSRVRAAGPALFALGALFGSGILGGLTAIAENPCAQICLDTAFKSPMLLALSQREAFQHRARAVPDFTERADRSMFRHSAGTALAWTTLNATPVTWPF
ncbi:unnamed protein product [Cylicostephanus goldi]|uniref:Uncharacterized protein n=1 Tax=Cylicostephanus goldi TaxID=71465 RepID=A0A3P7PZ10_CYLGO|nr:unnamed protein product [Cylicostephanus goldi]